MDDITVLVFGPLRERIGVSELHVDGATVQDVWDELVRRHPAAAMDAVSVRAARNLGYCEWGTAVESGDTVAFIPPVAGGSDDASPVRVWLTDVPIDIGSVIASSGTSHDGAVATFIGRVRDHNEGVAVQRLDYEAYAEMAEAEMRRIGRGAFRPRWDQHHHHRAPHGIAPHRRRERGRGGCRSTSRHRVSSVSGGARVDQEHGARLEARTHGGRRALG